MNQVPRQTQNIYIQNKDERACSKRDEGKL